MNVQEQGSMRFPVPVSLQITLICEYGFAAGAMLAEEGWESVAVAPTVFQDRQLCGLSVAMHGSASFLVGHTAHLLRNEQLPL